VVVVVILVAAIGIDHDYDNDNCSATASLTTKRTHPRFNRFKVVPLNRFEENNIGLRKHDLSNVYNQKNSFGAACSTACFYEKACSSSLPAEKDGTFLLWGCRHIFGFSHQA
jgi:hypothetical protein